MAHEPIELIPAESVRGRGPVGGLSFLGRLYAEHILEGWSHHFAIQILGARERRAFQEARTLRAESERIRAHIERAGLLAPPAQPLSVYEDDREIGA
jgi:hypothetical protein